MVFSETIAEMQLQAKTDTVLKVQQDTPSAV